jgi:hypothetical protein
LRGSLDPGLAVLVSVCLFLPAFDGALVTGPTQLQAAPAYPNSSWAIGVVVPEGAHLLGGGNVRWEDVTNVTASLALPNIESPDRNVYAILSVMTSDGSVLQAAAGALPNRTGWLGFAWSVHGGDSGSPSYLWVLNGSKPEMSPAANISVSIFRTSGQWGLRVADMDTGSSVEDSFPPGPAPALKAGDQEVFAIESYSRTLATFRGMGNLTLYSISLDGKKVTNGCYLFSDWDMIHNPLFVVGSSGSSPPSFIYAGEASAGHYFWDYTGVWEVQQDSPTGLVEVLAAVAVAGAVALGGVAVWLAMRKSGPKSAPGPAS